MTNTRDSNCLNTLRIIAALQVAILHMENHLDISMPKIFDIVFGYFRGVPFFFLVSGFLIYSSVSYSKNFKEYLRKRFLRIYPELWTGVFIEILMILLFYNVPSYSDLFLFGITQSTFLQFWTPNSLRGYGCGTPNGSLWTICVLIQFYILCWFLKKFLHGKKNSIWIICFIISIFLGMIPNYFDNSLPLIINKLYNQTVFNYLYLFISGAYISEKQDILLEFLKNNWYYFTIFSILLYIIKIDIPYTNYSVIESVLCGYGLIGFSYSHPKLNLKKDISYGLYIYHMTVVNVFICLGYTQSRYYLIISLLLSIIIAYISLETIGKWSKNRKTKLVKN